ncbi:RNA polymerase sigma factor [Sinomicrobium pectinilyticum]|nr:RNA polymerase sigma-70 factor [Sinomicrobium pectinilyticum]
MVSIPRMRIPRIGQYHRDNTETWISWRNYAVNRRYESLSFKKRREVNNSNSPKVDIKLVRALKEGDETAFETIFNLLRERLYYFVFSYTKSEYIADEIVQEVFIRVWQKRETIKPLTFTTFLFTIAKNLTFNHLRDTLRREAAKEELWKNISSHYEQIETKIRLAEYRSIVNNIVDTLSHQKKIIYHLSREEGKTNTEIAEILGITPKTVKNHLWKIMEIIRTHLRPHLESTLWLLITLLSV